MITKSAPQLVLATGETITLTGDEDSWLHTALRTRRARKAKTRDVVSEVAAFLDRNPGSSATEVARGIGARDSCVREVLETDPQFQNVPVGPGRSAQVRAWIVAPAASQPGPNDGTTSSVTGNGRAS